VSLFESAPTLLIVLLFLLLFGSTQIPKLMRSLGRAKGEFNLAKREMEMEAARVEAEAMKAKPAATGSPDETQVRKTARELGIAEAGMSLDEVKTAIRQKLA
jgi:TatA/E family protein of Tat protein translocase